MSYTPGPWKIRPAIPEPDDGSIISHIVAPDTSTVAEINESFDEDGGNAHLIAAAPDLLEAAKLALTSMSARQAGTNPDTAYVKRTIQVAIAKAEGVQALP